MAVRENRLKLTPPSTTVAPRGELRPMLSAEAPRGGPRWICLATVTTTSLPSAVRPAGRDGMAVVRSTHSRGWATWFQRPMIGSSRFLCSKPSTPTLAGRQ